MDLLLLGPIVGTAGLPKKAAALLGYLAVLRAEGRAHAGRGNCAELLWGRQSEEQSRHSLRNVLLETRKKRPDWIDGDWSRLGLAAAVETDLDRFAAAESRGDPAAAGLWRGPLLAELDIAGAENFEEWLSPARQRWQDRAARLCVRLGSAALAQGDRTGAARLAARAVEIDPWDEAAVRLQMRAFDRPHAALFYRDWVSRLRDELAVRPDRKTSALAAELFGTPHFTDVTGGDRRRLAAAPRPEPAGDDPAALAAALRAAAAELAEVAAVIERNAGIVLAAAAE